MRSTRALSRLRKLLKHAGVDARNPTAEDLATAVDVMQRFGREEFSDIDQDEGGDLFLAEYLTYDWGSGETFQVDLTRQFRFIDRRDGEFLEFRQLHCSFHYVPTAELRGLGSASLWSLGLEDGHFWASVKDLEGFRISHTPLRLDLEYFRV